VSTIELAQFLAASYKSHPWVTRLVDTTSIWIVPMTNAIGYERFERLEMGLFPNRDFGYVQRPDKCMTTIAGRTVNELFRRHLFQIVVTFHGGMTSIGYPWGSFNHHRKGTSRAPDDAALADIARSMSAFASTGGVDKTYPYGTMNDQVYPVFGGMEDWGYAASFDPASRIRCEPRSHGGYETGHSTVTNASARALVFLVEAGPKKPPERTLGSNAAVLTPGSEGDGHVPRNIRLSLTAIDFLRPYVELLIEHTSSASGGGASIVRATVGRALPIRWRAWGATRLDSAEIVWRRSAAEPWQAIRGSAGAFNALSQRGGVWASTPAHANSGEHTLCAIPLAAGTFQLAVRVSVDSHWADNGGRRVAPASMPPQSHLTRARTDGSWRMENGESRVVGRTSWLSPSVEVRVGGPGPQGAPQSAAPFRADVRACAVHGTL